VSDDFRRDLEDLYRPGHTHFLAGVLLLRVLKIRQIVSKDHDLERLVRIGLVEIDEGGLPLATDRVVNTRNTPAYRRSLPDVGFCCGSG
jgi:hypothetical protein